MVGKLDSGKTEEHNMQFRIMGHHHLPLLSDICASSDSQVPRPLLDLK